MSGIFDFLKWRGDLRFFQAPLNAIDALVFSVLSYVWYDGIVSDAVQGQMTLKEAAEKFFEMQGYENKVRVKRDISFLKAASETERFGNTKLGFYRSLLNIGEEKQFAAITFWLDDGTVVLAFRGTDQNLAGWKEDFNMAFYESIPAQKEALRYVEEFSAKCSRRFYLVGHSKGGNLSVYAAAKISPEIQQKIIKVYNHDGPGFTDYLMGDEGYLAIVPKIKTYIPQSSVVGMLFGHEEPYSVIKSTQHGFMQHDPYSWVVEGKDFIYMEGRTSDSKVIDKALKNWLAGMSLEERSNFIDAVYEILISGGASQTMDLVQPKNVRTYMKTLSSDEKKRRLIASELAALVQSVKAAQRNKEE